MGQQGGTGGRADYYAQGDWNVACSECGRKRKSRQMVRNWQGQYRCPEHNEPRQPQDFARGVKDDMSVPFVQMEQVGYTDIIATFPLTITTSSLQLPSGVAVGVAFPSWVTPASPNGISWGFSSGGAGITITSPHSIFTTFSGTGTGVAQVTVTSTVGATATAFLSLGSAPGLLIDISQDYITALNTNGVGVALSSLMTGPQITAWQAGTYGQLTLVATGSPSRGYWVISGGLSNSFPSNPASPGLLIDVFNGSAPSIININTATGFNIYGAGGTGATQPTTAATAGGSAIFIASTSHTVNINITNGSNYILGGGGGGGGDLTNLNTGGGGGAAGWRAIGSLGFDSPKYFDPNHSPAGTGNIAMAGALGNPAGGTSGCGNGGGLGQIGFPDGGGSHVGASGGYGVFRNGVAGTTVVLSGGGNIAGTVQ